MQYFGKQKTRKIDAEKAGQALFAFFNKMPGEAKNDKKLIFAEKYEEVFSDSITANSILTVFKLFNHVESKKIEKKVQILADATLYDDQAYILYSSYYILYTISELADIYSIPKDLDHIDKLLDLYDQAEELIKKTVEDEKKNKGIKEKYNHGIFFKSNKPKMILQRLLKE